MSNFDLTAQDAPRQRELATLGSEINDLHDRVVEAARTAVEHARECGELLNQAKAQIAHGGFQEWLQANCRVKPRQAQNYMRLAREWPAIEAKCAPSAHLTIAGALQLILEPKPADNVEREVHSDLTFDKFNSRLAIDEAEPGDFCLPELDDKHVVIGVGEDGDFVEIWPITNHPGHHRLFYHHRVFENLEEKLDENRPSDDEIFAGQYVTWNATGEDYCGKPRLLRWVLQRHNWRPILDWIRKPWDGDEPEHLANVRKGGLPATSGNISAWERGEEAPHYFDSSGIVLVRGWNDMK